MKKVLFAFMLLLFALNVYGQAYEAVERTTRFGLIPILSDTNDRTDGYYLPSVLAANKEGYAFIDANFTKGGLIVPFLGNSLVVSAWYENGNSRNLVDIPQIMSILQPGGPDMPDTKHLMGLSLGGNINENIALGLNFRYLLGREEEKNVAGTTIDRYQVSTDRIELTPSITYRQGSLFVDFGLNIDFQWMTEKAEGTFEYDRTTTYESNADFAMFARSGFSITKYSDMVLSAGFGVLPISEKQLAPGNTEVATVDLDSYFWNVKIGSIIKPTEWMKIHPSLLFTGYHVKDVVKQLNVAAPEKMTDKLSAVTISLMLGMDLTPVDWFSLKAGVVKDFLVVDESDSAVIADTSSNDYRIDEGFGAYFGPTFMWKGFSFISTINLDFFTQGPYMISGNAMTSNWAYVATVEYKW